MFQDTATYKALLAAAAASPRSRAVAEAAFLDLATITSADRPALRLPKSTLRERRTLYRRAGLAPICDARHLAGVLRDLRPLIPARERVAAARLVWVLNADRQARRERVARRYAPLLAQAAELLGASAQDE